MARSSDNAGNIASAPPLEPFVKANKPILNVECDSPAEAVLRPKANAFPMATDSENVDVTSIAYSCSGYGGGEA
jgi:hypothetical protein